MNSGLLDWINKMIIVDIENLRFSNTTKLIT